MRPVTTADVDDYLARVEAAAEETAARPPARPQQRRASQGGLTDYHRKQLRDARNRAFRDAVAADPNAPAVTRLRVERGWTIDELAEYAGCGRSVLVRLAAGKPVNAKSVERVARVLGVPAAVVRP